MRDVDEALAELARVSDDGTILKPPDEDQISGWCLYAQRTCWGVGAKYLTAWLSGQHAGDLALDTPKRGSIGYWSGGHAGSGHVVTCTGDGWCWTTDFLRSGKIDLVLLDDLFQHWSSLRWEGWSHIVNDVTVLTKRDRRAARRGRRGAAEILRPHSLEDNMPMIELPPRARRYLPANGCNAVSISHPYADVRMAVHLLAEDGNAPGGTDPWYRPEAWAASYDGDNVLTVPKGLSVSGLRDGTRGIDVENRGGATLIVRTFEA